MLGTAGNFAYLNLVTPVLLLHPELMNKVIVLAAYFWSLVQGLRAFRPGLDDQKISNRFLAVSMAVMVLLPLVWFVATSMVISVFFYPIMPLFMGSIFTAACVRK